MRLDEVPAVFTAARFLWLSDRSIQNVEDDTYRTWHRHLAPYSVDETTAAMDALLASNAKYCPSLGVLVGEIRAIRHRAQVATPEPVQLFAKKHSDITGPDTEYRAKLRKDAIAYHRSYKGHVSQEKLAEIDAWVDEIGPFEQAFLAQHGIHVELSQPQRTVGNAVVEEVPA